MIIGYGLFHMVFLKQTLHAVIKDKCVVSLSSSLENLRLTPNLLYVTEDVCITYIRFFLISRFLYLNMRLAFISNLF